MASKWQAFMQLPLALRVGAVAVAVGPVVTIGLYALRFHKNGLSTNPDDWAGFGSYLGGILGWLVSLIALLAVYATYLKQQESDSEQKQRLERNISLLEEHNQKLAEQVDIARREAFNTQISSLVLQLIQSILGCRREHESAGVIAGQAYFHEYADQFWSRFQRVLESKDSEPLKSARRFFFTDESNWLSVRGQLELIIYMVHKSRLLNDAQRRRAMHPVLAQLTPGIATFLALDSGIAKNNDVLIPADTFGLFRHVDERLQCHLASELGVPSGSFEDKSLAAEVEGDEAV